MVQVVAALTVAPLMVMTLPPVTVTVPPPHCGEVVVAVNAPAPGKVSIKPTTVRLTAPAAVLSMVKLRVAV